MLITVDDVQMYVSDEVQICLLPQNTVLIEADSCPGTVAMKVVHCMGEDYARRLAEHLMFAIRRDHGDGEVTAC